MGLSRCARAMLKTRLNRPIHLVLDWDGTLTTKDTMAVLASSASHRDARLGCEGSSRLATMKRHSWTSLGKAYAQDYEQHVRAYAPSPEHRTSISAERVWLESLRKLEDDSAQRVEAAGYFADVTSVDLANAAKEAAEDGQLQLRKGWDRLLASLSNQQSADDIMVVDILSVNWSRTFIQQSLGTCIRRCRVAARDDAHAANLDILHERFQSMFRVQANELTHLARPDNERPADSVPELRTSQDKVHHLRKALRADSDAISVYVGDSATDLECLLETNVGICIRDELMGGSQTELSTTLQRLKIPVHHVSEYRTQTHGSLWWARDFDEVADFLEIKYGVHKSER